MKKGKILIVIIIFISLFLGSLLFFGISSLYNNWQSQLEELNQAKNELQKQYDDLADQFRLSEEKALLISFWVEQDGYDDPDKWWNDISSYRTGYLNCDTKVLEGNNAEYITEEQKQELHKIAEAINKSRSPKELKELVDRFNEIVKDIKQQKEKILQETTYEESDSWEFDNYYDNNYYDISTDGLTQASGVNYYNGRTETYYSSNVLYHYKTNEWTVDNEGFYRTDEGYYVVAASDMTEGTTFEGSKGTCIVLDSGCSEGVTDYYVAW